jgi:AAA domain
MLEAHVVEFVCAKFNWKNIEQPSFGKGWVACDDEWRRFIRAITAIRDKHGVTVVLVCHATIERVDDPRAPSYTAYAPKLHKRARALVMDACDLSDFSARTCASSPTTAAFASGRARPLRPAVFYSWRGSQPFPPRTGSECRKRFRSP